jgi:hypothetical protein
MPNRQLDEYIAAIGERLQALAPGRRDEELREIRQHLEALVEGYIAQGYGKQEAIVAALRQFGPVERIGAELREVLETRRVAPLQGLWKPALIYLISVALIFGFFITANDKPQDFPYERADQILLALVLPLGVFAKVLIDELRLRRARHRG